MSRRAHSPAATRLLGNGLGYAQLALGMAIFGSGTPVSKWVTDAFPVFLASGLRMAIAAAVLTPFLWFERDAVSRMTRSDWSIVGAIALIGMFGFSVFMLYGMREVSGVVGSVVMSTTPAITALGAYAFLKEHLGMLKALAVALAVAGVLVLHLGSGQGDPVEASGNLIVGSLLVLAAVCSEAGYTLLGKRASASVPPVVVAALAAWIALALFLPFALAELDGTHLGDTGWRDWLALGWWGAGTLALGSVLWYRGVAKVPGGTAAGFMGVMPVSALVLSYVLLGEAFLWIHLAGFGIVMVSVLLVAFSHAKTSRAGDSSD